MGEMPIAPHPGEFCIRSGLHHKICDFDRQGLCLNGGGEAQQSEIVLANRLRRIRQPRDVKDDVFPKDVLNHMKEKPRDAVQELDSLRRVGKQDPVLLPFCVEPSDFIVRSVVERPKHRTKYPQVLLLNLFSRFVFSQFIRS